jgi:hypothetical protein
MVTQFPTILKVKIISYWTITMPRITLSGKRQNRGGNLKLYQQLANWPHHTSIPINS